MPRPTILFVNLRRPPLEVREALLAARRVGCDVALLADKVPGYVRPYVTVVEEVDTFDTERAVEAAAALAARHPIRGVVTWAERDVELVAQIGAALDLPALTPAAARLGRHKYEMKQALAGLGLSAPHALVRSWEDLRRALDHVPLPAVLKPAGASGSKGIYDVRTRAEAERAFHELQEITTPAFDPIFQQFGSDLVLEEFLTGHEIAACGWVVDGEVSVVSIADTYKTRPWYLEVRGIYPSGLDKDVQDLIARRIAEAATAIGFDRCAIYVDGILDGGDFKVIEIGGRPSGDYHGSHVVPLALGIDFYESVLRIALGGRPSPVPPAAVTVAGYQFIMASGEGVLEGVDGLEDVLAMPEVDRVSVETPVGAPVRQPPAHFGASRVAAVLASDPDRNKLIRALDRVVERTEVVLAPS